MTLTELQSEVKRRVSNLLKQKQELHDKLQAIEHELASVAELGDQTRGHLSEADLASDNGHGKRRMSADDYAEGVRSVLETGVVYSTTELCNALVAAGYGAKKSTLTQGMAAHLVDSGVLVDKGKRGRSNQYELAC